MKKWIFSLAVILVLLLAACGNSGDVNTPQPQESVPSTPSPTPVIIQPEVTPEPTPEPTPEVEVTPEPVETPEVYTGPQNPLTGLPIDPEKMNDRPVAIMLNNIKSALPMQGVAQADIIYEVLAEGGIPRIVGIYQDVDDVGIVGSVRSARTYFVELALGHDSIFLHAGGSPDSYNKIKEWGVTSLDCVNGPYEGTLFWRDSQRLKTMSREHTVVTSGSTIQKYFPKYSFSKEHADGYSAQMNFVQDGTPVNGTDAVRIEVPFSNYKTGVFQYDPESGKYLVEQYGKEFVDGNTGEQIAVTNVLVLKTRCAAIPGDNAGRITVDLVEGEGWFACGGKIIPIHWSKDGVNSPIVYSTVDGEALTLGVGTSYVNIIPLTKEIVVK